MASMPSGSPATGTTSAVMVRRSMRCRAPPPNLYSSPSWKVQLPPEGRTVMLEFEEAGAVLAVVQKLGGAFLWFPSKPEAIQQWEGMSFSSNFKVTKRITRNQHFDTDFACWSEVGKLVLGPADLPHISPRSRTHLPCISPASPLHLPRWASSCSG